MSKPKVRIYLWVNSYTEAVKCMLNFNASQPSESPQWKILVYDQLGRDIISPLLTVKELRSLGVTLHLLLESSREPIPDVPAVYFVQPSEENIRRICKDFSSGLYENYYLNFISPISRDFLEQIAQTALSEDCVQQISKVFDQYTNFICLENDLLVFKSPTVHQNPTYYALNRPKALDADIDSLIDSTVDGLFSVFATLGCVPIIRCPRGDASEMIAARLETKLRDCLRDSRNSLFMANETSRSFAGRDGAHTGLAAAAAPFPAVFQRPLLVLLDRNLDLATPLHHEMTYQSLVHDIFNIRLNRVQIDLNLTKELTSGDQDTADSVFNKRKPPRLEQYDLNSINDRLWREFKHTPFADLTDAIRDEVSLLKEYEKRMGELKTSMGLSGDLSSIDESALTLLDDNTTRLTSAVSSLPQLLERKRCLDMHTNIATCLANTITQRQLHVFAEEEDKLWQNRSTTDCNLSELITDPKMGTPEDKLRLLVFAALLRSGFSGSSSTSGTNGTGSGASLSGGVKKVPEFCLSDSELSRLRADLKAACPELELNALDYVQHLRHLLRMGQSADTPSGATAGRNVLNKLVSHGSAIFFSGVRQLIGHKMHLPFTRIVSQLMENRGGSEVDDYLYFDPKLHRRQGSDVPRFKQPFYEAFLFVVGGGSYVEYHDLLDWARAGTAGLSSPSSSTNLTGMVNGTSADTGAGMRVSSVSTGASSSNGAGGGSLRRVIYGCTELQSPSEFLHQLTMLGKELS